MNSNGGSSLASTVGVFLLAVLIIGIVGAYAIINPSSPLGAAAIGALLPIAGGIGTYFFHTAGQAFLGQQLQSQAAIIKAVAAPAQSPPPVASTSAPATSYASSTPSVPVTSLESTAPTAMPGSVH